MLAGMRPARQNQLPLGLLKFSPEQSNEPLFDGIDSYRHAAYFFSYLPVSWMAKRL
jgi:hypothetical protein